MNSTLRPVAFAGSLTLAALTLAAAGTVQPANQPAGQPASQPPAPAPSEPAAPVAQTPAAPAGAQPATPAQPSETPAEAPAGAEPEPPSEAASTTRTLSPDWVKAFEWRSIGPANMGGRITDLAVVESNPSTYWVATASGGLLKTTNNGVTFEHQFDRESTVSIGDVTVAPSDPEIVWVGTGEANPRNSVSWGDGVYKSTDGGKTWTNMGLRESRHIGRILIHPADANVVYVGAMGRTWGPSEERGLYKTTNGGETWSKILSIDESTGVIDMVMHPKAPDTLLVATWERQRDGFDTNDPAKKWGPGSGLHKTTDGGQTFQRLTSGLPTNPMGRMGLDLWRKSPDTVVLTVDCEKIGMVSDKLPFLGMTGENADAGARMTRIVDDGPAAKAGLKVGDIVLAVDGEPVLSYDDLLKAIRGHVPEDTVKLSISREREPLEIEVTLGKRPDDENARPHTAYLGGQRANVQDEQGPDGHEFGGVYRSDDFGETWTRINSLNPRPMYFSKIRIDPTDDQVLWVLGVSLHISRDGGESFRDDAGRGVHADHHAMWINPADPNHVLLGCDGGLYVTFDQGKHWDHLNHMALGQFYHVAVDPRIDYRVYGGLQDNGSWGGPSRLRSGGMVNTDWFRVGGGDGFVCLVDPNDPDQVYYESQNGGTGWRNLRTGRGGSIRPQAPEGVRYRFNWRTPFILSSHNTRIYYNAGNHVFRSITGGTSLKAISPEITRTDRGSATALAESPLDPDVLYVGTDDGALWMTRDGGVNWMDLWNPTPEPAPVPGPVAAASPPTNGEQEAEARAGAPEGQGLRRGEGGGARAGPGGGPGGGGGGGRLAEMLAQADQNGDGKLQKSELPERMQGFFDRLDANKDGALDRDEINAMSAARGGGRAPGRGPGEGPARRPGPGAGEEAESGEGGGGEQPAPPAPPATAQPRASEPATPAEPARAEPAAGTSESEQPAEGEAAPADPISGRWSARMVSEQVPPGAGGFELIFRMREGQLSADVRSQMFDGPAKSATFNAATGAFKLVIEGPMGDATLEGKVEGGKLTGQLIGGGGQFTMPFEADRATGGTRAAAARGRRTRERPAGPPGKPLKEIMGEGHLVSAIEASRHERGRVYVSIDGHRTDDVAPYVLVSEDYGRTWRSLSANLPTGSVRVVREDLTSPEILYVGTEFGAFVTVNRGQDWTRLNSNLPTVAVHELAQHPLTGEIVAATHGRSIWILDVTPLRQMTPEVIAASAHLFKPATAHIWRSEPSRGISGARQFAGENPPSSIQVFYSLAAAPREASLKVTTLDGQLVRNLPTSAGEAGLHKSSWDLRREPPQRPEGPQGRGGPGGGGFRGGRFGPRVEPGVYRLVLTVDGQEFTQDVTVAGDPAFPNDNIAEDEEADENMHRHPRQQDAPVQIDY